MPLQNRVTPEGRIEANAARGTLMGNRGILHDAGRRLGKARWKHPAWIACVLAFKGRRRELMRPGRYTELFFTDEAVALAAGHRPCAECRRDDYNRFRDAICAAHGETLSAPQIDRLLHKARVRSWTREQITHNARLEDLPEGVFFRVETEPRPLVRAGRQVWAWRHEGYQRFTGALPGLVEVLTPRPIVAALAAGYRLEGWPLRSEVEG